MTDCYPLLSYEKVIQGKRRRSLLPERKENDAARVCRRKGEIDHDDNDVDNDDDNNDDGGEGGKGECSDRATTPKRIK